MRRGDGLGAVQQYVQAMEFLDREEKCLEVQASELIVVTDVTAGSVVVDCTICPESKEVAERVQGRLLLLLDCGYDICKGEILDMDVTEFLTEWDPSTDDDFPTDLKVQFTLDLNYHDAVGSSPDVFNTLFQRDLGKLIFMDQYSLVGECRVRAERLALHRSVGSACFYRAELGTAKQ